MTVIWIDVSHHDWSRRGGNLDWSRVRTVTSPCMIARATYGDPAGWHRPTYHFGDFQAAAAAAGFDLRGGYHNLIRGDTASMRRQVDWLRRERDAYSCNWQMADVEPYAELVSANMWPRWEDVLRFQDAWHSVEDHPMAWYIPRWFWAWRDKLPSLGQPDLRQLRGPLIQSHYAGGDGPAAAIYANAGGDAGTGWDDFYGGRYPDIWQYTAGADVDGASSNTDANAFRGTLSELGALISGDDMAFIDDQNARYLAYRNHDFAEMVETVTTPQGEVVTHKGVTAIKQLLADVAELKARPPVQPSPVDPATLKAVLLDSEVLAAIAKAVADEDHARSAE